MRTIDRETYPIAFDELEERISEYRHLAYNWRCFGDGIAFLFMDKFALKQTFLNTDKPFAKQGAGFLSGKEGLQSEWKLVEALAARGIPALLTDLTNTIRHGDVCIMIDPDPTLIEVKSGKLDSRGRRQSRSIRQLSEFFETDEADGLRGLGKIRRISSQTDEVLYVDVINECIATAMRSGFAWRSPEKGLYYLVVADDQIVVPEKISDMDLNRPFAFFLNEFKADRDWAPYQPYTLSIRDREALYKFIWGEIYIVVLYEPDHLRQLAKREGVEIELQPVDSDIAFKFSHSGSIGPAYMSKQLFARLAFDFTSPSWLLRYAIELLNFSENTNREI